MEVETLTKSDRYNEYIMTGLRTIWGVSLNKVQSEFGEDYKAYLLNQAEKYLQLRLLIIENEILLTTKHGKFLCDGMASHLFKLNASC